MSRVFSRWRNPAPKPTTVPPGSPGFWEDSERFWRESAAFWDKQARISRDLMWLWVVVAALLITSAVLAVAGG